MDGPHLALSIPEILLEILEYLSVGEIKVVALVCKAWLGPVVDTKWRTKTIPLSCLLGRLAPIQETQRGCTALAPNTLITQDHWNRFLEQYANRITRLNMDKEFDKTSIELISTLLERFGGQLGSNITSLNWPEISHGDSSHLALIGLLHLTKLQEVQIPFEDHKSRLKDSLPIALSQLARLAPQISRIAGVGVYNSFDFSVFSRLRVLSHCGHLSTSDYHNLTHCKHLHTLRLIWTVVQVISGQQTNNTFSRLEKLGLIYPGDEMENMVLQSVMPALRTFTYRREEAGLFTVPLLNNILRTSPLLTVISVTVVVPPSQLELVQHNGVRRLVFKNLYRLRSELEARNPPDLSIIGGAFPKLEWLAVIFSQDHQPPSFRFSWHWHTLSALGDHLQHLQRLVLSLHVPNSLIFETPKGTAALPSLTHVKFQVLYIAPVDINAFVSYLAMLCPNILCMEVDVLNELQEDLGEGVEYVQGKGRTFVKRFFHYVNQIRESKGFDGHSVQGIQ
ncbi:hypothetical protein FRB94_012536 [Tulasnella sp. JGI-2019a]|nr:hypothetical protein FRB94_012536 [Tulasnella sp. JGI-2019a]